MQPNTLNDEDLDDLPPLEDMSDSLKKIGQKKDTPGEKELKSKDGSQVIQDYTKTRDEAKTEDQKARDDLDKKMARAMFNGTVSEGGGQKPQAAKKNPLEFKEVQENMKKNTIEGVIESSKDKWLTPDLLKKLQANPKLLTGLSDPEIMKAIGLMQVNPKEAKEKYKNNEKVTSFFVDFSKLMGTHFEGIAEEEKKKEEKVKEVPKAVTPVAKEKPALVTEDPVLKKKMEDPAVREILSDKKVMGIIEHLSKGKSLDFHQ